MNESWNQVSFGRYVRSGLLSSRPASKREIESMIAAYNRISQKCIDMFEKNAAKTMKLYAPAEQELLRSFFSEVRMNREVYENERQELFRQLIDDENESKRIVFHPLYGHLLSSDCVGDNCYEYALKDYYEKKLLQAPAAVPQMPGIFQQFMNVASPAIPKVRLPHFLLPGFSRQWPLFRDDVEAWAKRCDVEEGNADSVARAIMDDASAFGLSIKKVAYAYGQYTPTPGTTLFCGIHGYFYNRNTMRSEWDFHFYRYHPKYGLWSHKEGFSPVTCFDTDGNLIFDPSRCKNWYNKGSELVGFFEISIP